jgi:(E)-4-hydroxy-3-methylbut-2-enyl-diphosphate synthase
MERSRSHSEARELCAGSDVATRAAAALSSLEEDQGGLWRDGSDLVTPVAVGAQKRRVTRQIHVGSVAVGGGAPISVQSMTVTKTADVEGTLAQIYALAGAGADIVRCTCNEQAAAEGLAQIVPRSPVPIVADIHFHVEMALAALEAGVNGLRLNPGNLRKPEEIKTVAAEARDRGVPIRIGVNAGSLHPKLYEKYGGATPEALVESAQMELAYFEEVGFEDVKISVKASNVPLMIEAYRLAADTFDHPLHLGVTEAGPPPAGLLKATAGIATLLSEGIGDTIRYSLTADPVEEARAGRQLLEALGLRERKGLDLIACPSCGRAEIDVIGVAKRAQEALERLALPLQIAVMGCVVNGPGEAREADLGIAAGKKRGHLFIKGKIIRVVPEDEMVDALVAEAEKLVAEGIDARLAAADEGAAAEAEADRAALFTERGADANHAGERVEIIRKKLAGGPTGQ